jgi:hypothetical protein
MSAPDRADLSVKIFLACTALRVCIVSCACIVSKMSQMLLLHRPTLRADVSENAPGQLEL